MILGSFGRAYAVLGSPFRRLTLAIAGAIEDYNHHELFPRAIHDTQETAIYAFAEGQLTLCLQEESVMIEVILDESDLLT